MADWHVVYYEAANGWCPVAEFLDDVPARDGARMTKDIDLLEAYGTGLGMPYVRHLQGKIWELRTRGRTQYRILYVAIEDRQLLLLHAFAKKTERTPAAEIETAKRRLADYESGRRSR